MRFKFENQEFCLEFRRAKPDTRRGRITTYIDILPVSEAKREDWAPAYSAYSECSLKDKFSKEAGRIAALRKVTPKVPQKMRGLLWDAYMHRGLGIVPEHVTVH